MNNYECPSCKHLLSPDQKFCDKCGREVDEEIIVCETCHTHLPPTAKYCTHCGKLIQKGRSSATKIFQILFIFFVIFMVTVIVLRTDLEQPTIPERVSNVIDKVNVEELDEEVIIEKLPYKEITFNTLVFSGEVTHEVEISVPGPTNKSFMIDAVKVFLDKTSYKINEGDIVNVKVYEIDSDSTNKLQAEFIYVNFDINSEYDFPENGYQSLGNNIHAKWDVDSGESWFW